MATLRLRQAPPQSGQMLPVVRMNQFDVKGSPKFFPAVARQPLAGGDR